MRLFLPHPCRCILSLLSINVAAVSAAAAGSLGQDQGGIPSQPSHSYHPNPILTLYAQSTPPPPLAPLALPGLRLEVEDIVARAADSAPVKEFGVKLLRTAINAATAEFEGKVTTHKHRTLSPLTQDPITMTMILVSPATANTTHCPYPLMCDVMCYVLCCLLVACLLVACLL